MRALYAALVTAALVSMGCSGFGLTGNGQVQKDNRRIGGFDSVKVSGSGTLRVHQGDFKVVVTSDSNILPYIVTELVGSELRIGLKPGTSLFRVTKLEYDVTLPDLRHLGVSGSCDSEVEEFSGRSLELALSGSGSVKGSLDYAELRLSVSGSGGLDLDGDISTLEAELSGSCDLRLRGKADRGDISMSGSGSLDARGFEFGSLALGMSGSGRAEVRVRKDLDAKVSGSGNVKYWGNPEVHSKLSGSADVEKAGD